MNIIFGLFYYFSVFVERIYDILLPKYNIYLLKKKGAALGNNCRIRGKFFIKMPRGAQLNIGSNFVLDSGLNINPLSSNFRASISIRKNAIVQIGNNVGISSSVLLIGNKLTIGDNVLVGAGCSIMDTEGHSLNPIERRTDGETGVGKKAKGILIEDDVWIGANTMICTGVSIGKCAVIGANSVIRNNVPPYSLVYGNPAKIVSFTMPPKDAAVNEEVYPVDQRIPLDVLKTNYSKYFIKRIKEIKEFIN